MAVDYQAIEIGFASIVTAIAAVIGGIYTGRNSRAQDENKARIDLENTRLAREQAEESAAQKRVEQIAQDAADLRKRFREYEAESETRLRECRRHAQRGWDLANIHFGMLAAVVHLMNNIFNVVTTDASPDRVVGVVKSSMKRMESIRIPISLEEPLDREVKREAST